MRFAVDTGGTFTDLVVEDDAGKLHLFKVPTTPDDPGEGILKALEGAAESMSVSLTDFLSSGEMFIHGTTHATNAMITGNTARTAFLTTKGHPDILVIREGGRLEPFNFSVPFPKPYVPRSLSFEVPERIGVSGEVLEPLNEQAVLNIIDHLKSLKVEAIGICLLWSTVNPFHENRIGELLDEHLPGVPYTLSHRLNPILREYRRASSACIDASLKPLMSHYLYGLSKRLNDTGFKGRLLMLTSKGGIMDFEDSSKAPIHTIGSGPSVAPIAGRHYALTDTHADMAIIADTGGTTYDVSLVLRGNIPMTPETWIGQRYRGHIVGFPSVDVKSIGAGGGSIAWVDEAGLLHVGPTSAGAAPGPACYRRGGTRPTVTDAALVLGYVDPEYFLGGAMKLDVDHAVEAIEREVGRPLGIDKYEASSAIFRLVTENMVGAIEEITVHQGMDPRNAVLVGGGGAAGLNCVPIARRLGCKTIVIPELGAALSATGALMSDLQAEYRALYYTTTDGFDFDGVNGVLDSLLSKCKAFREGPGAGAMENVIDLHAEARYRDQIWEIDVPLKIRRFDRDEDILGLRKDFDRMHEEVFAFCDEHSAVQIVGWRATVRCILRSRNLGKLDHDSAALEANVTSSRKAYFPQTGIIDTHVELMDAMKPDVPLKGPAIIESAFTTIVIDPGAEAIRRGSGSLVIAP